MSPVVVEYPAYECPPDRATTGTPFACAHSRQLRTSSVEAQRAIAAGAIDAKRRFHG